MAWRRERIPPFPQRMPPPPAMIVVARWAGSWHWVTAGPAGHGDGTGRPAGAGTPNLALCARRLSPLVRLIAAQSRRYRAVAICLGGYAGQVTGLAATAP